MARIGLQFKGPAMPRAQDAFRSEDEHWFATDKERKFYRVVRSQPPAMITFSYVDRAELVEDFLKPPPGGAQRRHGPVPVSRSIGREPHVRLGARGARGQVDRAAR